MVDMVQTVHLVSQVEADTLESLESMVFYCKVNILRLEFVVQLVLLSAQCPLHSSDDLLSLLVDEYKIISILSVV
ncbi:unnamed protein product, partial [Diamesa hyperborea]